MTIQVICCVGHPIEGQVHRIGNLRFGSFEELAVGI